jgi:hypothetical protein
MSNGTKGSGRGTRRLRALRRWRGGKRRSPTSATMTGSMRKQANPAAIHSAEELR